MQVGHMNFCRQLGKQCLKMLAVPSLSQNLRLQYTHTIDLCAASEKFLLPDGGTLLDDDELRALDPAEALHLPYKLLALEYRTEQSHAVSNFFGTRRILFVREHEDAVRVSPVDFQVADGQWKPRGTFAIPLIGFKQPGTQGLDLIVLTQGNDIGWKYLHEAKTVLAFLNALACSNVKSVRSTRSKTGKIKAALPFDTYHVLTIDVGRGAVAGAGLAGGSHRSPREHLRRGHIRRMEDGRRIWINATVVAAGRGSAKVDKDYRMTNSMMTAGAARMAA